METFHVYILRINILHPNKIIVSIVKLPWGLVNVSLHVIVIAIAIVVIVILAICRESFRK